MYTWSKMGISMYESSMRVKKNGWSWCLYKSKFLIFVFLKCVVKRKSQQFLLPTQSLFFWSLLLKPGSP